MQSDCPPELVLVLLCCTLGPDVKVWPKIPKGRPADAEPAADAEPVPVHRHVS